MRAVLRYAPQALYAARHLLFELRQRSHDLFPLFGGQPLRRAAQHGTEMTQVLESSRKTRISKWTIARNEKGSIRFRNRHPRDSRACWLSQFLARFPGPFIKASQELHDHIVFREQRMLILHPACESETRPTARATEDDPQAPARLLCLSLGLHQPGLSIALGWSMLLQKCPGDMDSGVNTANDHTLTTDLPTIGVDGEEYNLTGLGSLPVELCDGCRIRLDLFRRDYQGQVTQDFAMFLKV